MYMCICMCVRDNVCVDACVYTQLTGQCRFHTGQSHGHISRSMFYIQVTYYRTSSLVRCISLVFSDEFISLFAL